MDVNLLVCIFLGFSINTLSARGYEFDPDYLIPPVCKPCDAKSCPQLTFCAGQVTTDECGCCPRCSSGKFQPHAPHPKPGGGQNVMNVTNEDKQVSPCELRKCPKFKICMLNKQGLPICTCPSLHVCNKRRGKRANHIIEKAICGSDGNTYPTKCHLRLANCNSLKRIKRVHFGPCMKIDSGLDNDENTLIGNSDMRTGSMSETRLSKKEERARLKAIKRAKRKKMKKRKRKNRRLRKKEKKERKDRDKNKRRSKRRNIGYNPYSSHYDFLLRQHTNWGHAQVRKSRI